MTRNILIGTLFSLSFALFGQSPTILQDQLKLYKTIQTDSVNDINAKYAAALSGLLERAQKAGDKAAEEAIQLELVGAGHPVKADWIIGSWTVDISAPIGQKVTSNTSGTTEPFTFTFTKDGKVVRRFGIRTGGSSGVFVKLRSAVTTDYKVMVDNFIYHFSQSTSGKVEVLQWVNQQSYPDKKRALKFKATKVP